MSARERCWRRRPVAILFAFLFRDRLDGRFQISGLPGLPSLFLPPSRGPVEQVLLLLGHLREEVAISPIFSEEIAPSPAQAYTL